jgi:Leucine-rich repeat (LRR) protein
MSQPISNFPTQAPKNSPSNLFININKILYNNGVWIEICKYLPIPDLYSLTNANKALNARHLSSIFNAEAQKTTSVIKKSFEDIIDFPEVTDGFISKEDSFKALCKMVNRIKSDEDFKKVLIAKKYDFESTAEAIENLNLLNFFQYMFSGDIQTEISKLKAVKNNPKELVNHFENLLEKEKIRLELRKFHSGDDQLKALLNDFQGFQKIEEIKLEIGKIKDLKSKKDTEVAKFLVKHFPTTNTSFIKKIPEDLLKLIDDNTPEKIRSEILTLIQTLKSLENEDQQKMIYFFSKHDLLGPLRLEKKEPQDCWKFFDPPLDTVLTEIERLLSIKKPPKELLDLFQRFLESGNLTSLIDKPDALLKHFECFFSKKILAFDRENPFPFLEKNSEILLSLFEIFLKEENPVFSQVDLETVEKQAEALKIYIENRKKKFDDIKLDYTYGLLKTPEKELTMIPGAFFENFPELRWINFLDNKIYVLSEKVIMLSNLKNLFFRNNRLKKIPPNINKIPLHRVDFSENQISNIHLLPGTVNELLLENSNLEECPNLSHLELKYLSLSGNRLKTISKKVDETIRNEITRFAHDLSKDQTLWSHDDIVYFAQKKLFDQTQWLPRSIENLDLSYNCFDTFPQVSSFKELIAFSLESNQIIDFPNPDFFTKHLKKLFLGNNKITKIAQKDLKNLINNSSLVELDLEGNDIPVQNNGKNYNLGKYFAIVGESGQRLLREVKPKGPKRKRDEEGNSPRKEPKISVNEK